MTLSDTLIDLLDRSRNGVQFDKAGQRDLDAELPLQRAELVCQEIDETMLPRSLTFRMGDKSELVVHAGGRRLLKLITVKPASLMRAEDDIHSERDDKKLAQQNEAIGSVIGRFVAQSGALTVQSLPPDTNYLVGALGFMPDKIMDVARRTAASLTVVAPKPVAPVAEAPAATAPKKLDPTAAMKAMIRDKVAAAPVEAPKPAPSQPVIVSGKKTMSVVPPGSASDAQLRSFFSEVGPLVDFCAILNADGNIEAASGKLEDESLLDSAGQIVMDMNRWRGLTHEVLSRSQIIVMRAGGIQNQSIAYFADDYGVALAVFANTDLSRVFNVANKVLKAAGNV